MRTPPHSRRNVLTRNWESGKQDFLISCQSLRAQFLNACCLVLDACCLMPDACLLLAACCLMIDHLRGGGRRPPNFVDGSGRCSSTKQQASTRHQAASIKHQAASIKELGSETLARNQEIFKRQFQTINKPFRNSPKFQLSPKTWKY